MLGQYTRIGQPRADLFKNPVPSLLHPCDKPWIECKLGKRIMDKRELQRTMYELGGVSAAQRAALAVLAGGCVLLAWWLLAGPGVIDLGGWFGLKWSSGDAGRRICLAAGFSVYYVRILSTEFALLNRGVGWNEVFTIALWLLIIVLLLGVAGGTNPSPIGLVAIVGILLFAGGSWTNTYAEYARHVWKQKPENKGHLYTGGLFRFSRHPNYLGDLLSFSGLCMISGAWITASIPVLMLAGFVFVNIPVLDSHLHDHYGNEFDAYAQRTRKLIPFVY
jgi:protein-S-isoprenylcysteine O-methyltransferase Ste14